MARKITFIHAADLHLGATFKGLLSLSEDVGNRFIEAISQSFQRIVDECVMRQVDFLILAGDTFNEGEVSYRTQREFLDAMQRLDEAGITVYLCTGNHDPLSGWNNRLAVLPHNVFVFPSSQAGYFLYEKNDVPLVALAGRSFETQEEKRDLTSGLSREVAFGVVGPTPFSVGVLHTGLTDARYAPCKMDAIYHAGFDYFALGHLHKRGVAGSIPAFFAGSPQGLDINENSEHGCMLVTLEENRNPVYTFISTASIVWEQPVLSLDGITDSEELFEHLVSCVQGLLAQHHLPVCARITLVGHSTLHDFLRNTADVKDLLESVAARCSTGGLWVWIDCLIDKTVAPIDYVALENEGLFPAAVLDESAAALEDIDATVLLIAEAFSEAGISSLVKEIDAADVVARAQSICLDALIEGGLR